MSKTDSRQKIIVRTSIIGIVANVLLAGFKAAVGLFVNSIAIVLDAVNNLSDALSSIITIVGSKISGRKPDKKHPFGHGRAEYISSMLVAAIILYAGVTSVVESVKKIITPEKADYNTASLVIISVAIVVKLVLGVYVKKKGKSVNSGALVASGSDALFDAIISASVLASAIIYLIWGVSLEAYVGVIISLIIIKAGFDMIRETLSDILGRRADPELSTKIKQIISDQPEVLGAYDLILNNYGPEKNYGSVHIELPDTMTVEQVDVLTRKIEAAVYHETGVILTGVGVYAFNTSNDRIAEIRNDIYERILTHDWALQVHGFYADLEAKSIRFDVVFSFDIDHKDGLEHLYKEIGEAYPEFSLLIIPDSDITD